MNLGYDCLGENGSPGEKLKEAIIAFQKDYNLDESGQMDEATQNKLLEVHGS
jgi:peptidoglycan hydrolase-like protein with peptidoglycan-binding domain